MAESAYVLHTQENRTVDVIFDRYIHSTKLKGRHIDDLQERLFSIGIVHGKDYERWRKTNFKDGKTPTKKDILKYIRRQIERSETKYRARDALMAWLGGFDTEERNKVYEEERAFAVKEIHKRESLRNKIRRADFKKFGFVAGKEKGPNGVFDAMLKFGISESPEKSIRSRLITSMKSLKLKKSVLESLGLQIKNEKDWLSHCEQFATKQADICILIAASKHFQANVHIIYICEKELTMAEEFILYSSALVTDKNFFLAHLGGQKYASLVPALGTGLCAGSETDRDTMRGTIQKQSDLIKEQKMTLKQKQKTLKNLKETMGNHKEEIERLERDIKSREENLKHEKEKRKKMEKGYQRKIEGIQTSLTEHIHQITQEMNKLKDPILCSDESDSESSDEDSEMISQDKIHSATTSETLTKSTDAKKGTTDYTTARKDARHSAIATRDQIDFNNPIEGPIEAGIDRIGTTQNTMSCHEIEYHVTNVFDVFQSKVRTDISTEIEDKIHSNIQREDQVVDEQYMQDLMSESEFQPIEKTKENVLTMSPFVSMTTREGDDFKFASNEFQQYDEIHSPDQNEDQAASGLTTQALENGSDFEPHGQIVREFRTVFPK